MAQPGRDYSHMDYDRVMEQRRKRARIAGTKFSKLHDWSDWGAARIERGTPWSRDTFGVTARSANPGQKAIRKMSGFTGRGIYVSPQVSGSGSYNFWKAFTGKKNRNLVGHLARTAIDDIAGRGAYDTSSVVTHGNNLIHGHQGGKPAHFSHSGDETGAVTITHKEYLTDLYGPTVGTAFQVQGISLNPALQSSFPFLSQIAMNYEEYEFIQLIFEYRSTTTDIGSSTSGQCGTVIMATNYNSASPLFTDKGSMMEYAHAHSCKSTEHMVHGVECDPKKSASISNVLYTRSNPVVSGQDLKTYDLGLFQVGLANLPSGYANQAIGELWVSYKVLLRKPKLFSSRGLDIDLDAFYNPSVTSAVSPVPTSSFWSAQQNNIGCLFEPGITYDYSGTTNPVQSRSTAALQLSVTFPANAAGNFRITVQCLVSVSAGGTLPYTAGSPKLLGNLNPIYDLVPVGGASAGTTFAANNCTAYASNVITAATVYTWTYQTDVFVRPATGIAYGVGTTQPNGTAYSGGSNIIAFGFTSGTLCTCSNTMVRVEQYGANSLSSTSARITWVKQDGTSTTLAN